MDGEPVSSADFRGKFMLIYFGYTFCPDVCPTSLQAIADALDKLDPEASAQIVPIFISVDPARDHPEDLKKYVSYFHPRMIGLTGTPDQIARVAKEYRVYYSKVQEEGADPDDYLVDHTAITYLMGPDGKFLMHFPHGYDVDRMAERLAGAVEKYGNGTTASDGG
jgi:protein SCO1/2